ncbi:MAG: helix-turn-helix transcriptional regulator [Sphingobacteriales bacterium]|mgnify:CR=1 FL=1|nr:helix-turn-helix transcriptional regulator [Sphingobacteriales bacterium]
MYFAGNIKFLRKRLRMTQDELSQALQMPRPTLSGYENGVSQPTIKALLAFSQYFHVSVDTLLKVDLTKLTPGVVSMILNGDDIFITGTKLRVLSTTLSPDNKDNIELVNEKAKAGYATGFADPEFIKTLPVFQLPFLSKERKYRTFQISGDSMLPIPDGSYVTGEFVDNWLLIRDRFAYIIVTIEEGILFKIAENRIEKEKKLVLHSLNPDYQPFEIHVSQIREIWKFVNYISPEIPEPNLPRDELTKTVMELKSEITEIKRKLWE